MLRKRSTGSRHLVGCSATCAAVVTVVDRRVAVKPWRLPDKQDRSSSPNPAQRPLQLGADQQLGVTQREWAATPIAVDVQRTTS